MEDGLYLGPKNVTLLQISKDFVLIYFHVYNMVFTFITFIHYLSLKCTLSCESIYRDRVILLCLYEILDKDQKGHF